MLASVLLFWMARGRASSSLRLFAVGVSLAVAVHLCFDFFPRGWTGFALIHVPVYGKTTALFSQSWIILSIAACLYLGFLLLKNIAELMLGFGSLIISFAVAAAEEGRAILSAFLLLALITIGTIIIVRQAQKAAARRA